MKSIASAVVLAFACALSHPALLVAKGTGGHGGSHSGGHSIVDDFDGVFQRMTLTPGPHHIVVQSPGYEPLAFDVAIDAHHVVTYKGVLQR